MQQILEAGMDCDEVASELIWVALPPHHVRAPLHSVNCCVDWNSLIPVPVVGSLRGRHGEDLIRLRGVRVGPRCEVSFRWPSVLRREALLNIQGLVV